MDLADQNNFVYDPNISGYNGTFWARVAGASDPTVSGGKLRFNANGIASFGNYSGFGSFEFILNVPVKPTSGDVRSWGFKSPALGSRARIEFDVTGPVFSAQVFDNAGNNLLNFPIAWDDTNWSAHDISFLIQKGFGVTRFYVAGVLITTIENIFNPVTLGIPLHVNNGNADNMDMTAIVIQKAQTIS